MLDNDCPFCYSTTQTETHQPKGHPMNTPKVIEEFEKAFLKKEAAFPRIKPEDISVFDFDNKNVKNGVIFLTGKSPIPVGTVVVGQKDIIKNADSMRSELHRARYSLISHKQDEVSLEREEEIVRGFSWIVRLYRWLHRKGWEMVSLECQTLIDGLIHSSDNECHQKLVIKNPKEDSTITICKLFHKRGYLLQQRSLSSLLDKDNSNIKTVVVDKIIQIKKAITGFAGPSFDENDLLNL